MYDGLDDNGHNDDDGDVIHDDSLVVPSFSLPSPLACSLWDPSSLLLLLLYVVLKSCLLYTSPSPRD